VDLSRLGFGGSKEKLRADGFIYKGYTGETVKAWLKEENK